ncbi:hypothetical protein CCAX7_22160 [Capsulimonas corticalis]|uniref:Uncharacterized protein n=1 Tax=Capsulimonas corticalis TaxID=2219043 RepID=A0A402D263_9BACT|nr:hypothetical protein [Capsulimonas corticalis]BDI30165.1 hypothetical protein CCAX7_22160 [Capsulimonas corticalis]
MKTIVLSTAIILAAGAAFASGHASDVYHAPGSSNQTSSTLYKFPSATSPYGQKPTKSTHTSTLKPLSSGASVNNHSAAHANSSVKHGKTGPATNDITWTNGPAPATWSNNGNRPAGAGNWRPKTKTH